MIFVEGLNSIPQVPPGSVALISKIHHAAIDGMSGADVLSILFDTTSKRREVPLAKKSNAAVVPGNFKLVIHSVRNFITRPLNLPRLIF